MKHANNESDLAVSARRSRIQIKKRILILMQMKIQLKGPGGVDRQTDARREVRKHTAEQMNKGTLTEGGERGNRGRQFGNNNAPHTLGSLGAIASTVLYRRQGG